MSWCKKLCLITGMVVYTLTATSDLYAKSSSCPNEQLPPPPVPDPTKPFPQTNVITPIETCATTPYPAQCLPPDPRCLPDLTGKNVLVVGGSRGMGKATAILMAQAGANVVATSRVPEQ